jgi:hypothetical protein
MFSARHAERETERQTGREPDVFRNGTHAVSRRSLLRSAWAPSPSRSWLAKGGPAGSSSRHPVAGLAHRAPDVDSSFGRAWIAGEEVVLKGTLDLAIVHAAGVCGDTEGDVRGSGSVGEFGGGAESFERGQ